MTAAEPEIKQAIASYWDGRSRNFERIQGIRTRRQKAAWLAFLREALGPERQSVLDVGTGTGFLALLAAELGHDACGLDLSPGMVEMANLVARERGVDARFEVADAEGLAAPDASFDRVINRNVLWTLPEPERALEDWRRVLKPGGRLVVVDGDWFDDRLSYRTQQFLGSLWIAITERRNPWADRRRLRQQYDGAFERHLPLKGPGNRQRMPQLVALAGFTNVRVVDLTEVDAAEKAPMTRAQRLLQPHRFFAILAEKPPI